MATTDSNGILFYEVTDALSPLQVLLNAGQQSVSDALGATARIFPVANVAARTALAASSSPSPATPLFVFRADAPSGSQLEYTTDGTTWVTLGAGALPHVRLGNPSTQSRPGGAWSQINLATASDISGSQPWSYSAGAVTINEAGLYQMDAAITASAATFAVQIYRVGDTAALAQSPTGSGASFSNSVSCTRRLAAGDVIIVRIYPSATMNVEADGITKPSFITFTRLSS